MTTDGPTLSDDGGDSGDGGKDPLIGTLIDQRYRVIGRIGDGGMGIVYKVEHTYLNKLFAMKVMRPTRDAVDRARFDQEAKLASKIRHKNVVEISDFGMLPTGQPYFVMEFLRGHNLGDAIYDGRIDALLACHIAAQIASGLQAVHKQNVVHRDLKPDNIFLIDPDDLEAAATEGGPDTGEWNEPHFVKIMDFGIAKSVDKNLTGTGMTLGTPEYMSPEQATGEKIDWRSDQYSLGCILYEMLTGELPFNGKGAFEIMQKHLSEAPVPPRKRRPENAANIPDALEKAVLTMMAKKPAARYQSMRQVEQLLRDMVTTLRSMQATTVVQSPQAKTLVVPPPVAPLSAVATLPPPGKGAAISEAATRPMLQALRPNAPPPPEPEPAASMVKTLLMPPSDRPQPGGERGHTPTPKLIDKLAVRVKGSSSPELPPPPWWQRYAILRWLYFKLMDLRQHLRRG